MPFQGSGPGAFRGQFSPGGPPYAQLPGGLPAAAAAFMPGMHQGHPVTPHYAQPAGAVGANFNGYPPPEGGKSREFLNPDGVVFIVTGDSKNASEDLIKSLPWARLNAVGRVALATGCFEKEGTKIHSLAHEHVTRRIKDSGGGQIDGWFRCPTTLWTTGVVQDPKKFTNFIEGKTLFSQHSVQLSDFVSGTATKPPSIDSLAKVIEAARNYGRMHGLVVAGILPSVEAKALYDMGEALAEELESGQSARYSSKIDFLIFLVERLIRAFEVIKTSPPSTYPISGGLSLFDEAGEVVSLGLASIFADLVAKLNVTQDTLVDYENSLIYRTNGDGSDVDYEDGVRGKRIRAAKDKGSKAVPPPKAASGTNKVAHCLSFAVGKCIRGDACSFQHAYKEGDDVPKSVLASLANTRVHDQDIMTAKVALFEGALGRTGIKLSEEQKTPLEGHSEAGGTAGGGRQSSRLSNKKPKKG